MKVYGANSETEGFIDVQVDDEPLTNDGYEEWNYKTIFDQAVPVNSSDVVENMIVFTEEHVSS